MTRELPSQACKHPPFGHVISSGDPCRSRSCRLDVKMTEEANADSARVSADQPCTPARGSTLAASDSVNGCLSSLMRVTNSAHYAETPLLCWLGLVILRPPTTGAHTEVWL